MESELPMQSLDQMARWSKDSRVLQSIISPRDTDTVLRPALPAIVLTLTPSASPSKNLPIPDQARTADIHTVVLPEGPVMPFDRSAPGRHDKSFRVHARRPADRFHKSTPSAVFSHRVSVSIPPLPRSSQLRADHRQT